RRVLFRSERVVVRKHLVARGDAGVDAHARTARQIDARDAARRRLEVAEHILGVHPRLDRVSARRSSGLIEGRRQRGALRDLELLEDDVDAADHLGDRMLDLDAGVHLEEARLALRIHEEFERAGPAIRGRAKNLERRASELVADRLGKVRSRRLLDELLKAALDRAVSLREDEPAAASIAEDLHLDVSAAFDVALGEDASVGA